MDENIIWMPKSEADKWEKFNNRIFRYMVLSIPETRSKRIEINQDNRKWAFIKYGNTQKMCFVDNKTMKAYKADGYSKTWIEIKPYTFVRWCTSFDL